jgi:excisionase family DNA binding protein
VTDAASKHSPRQRGWTETARSGRPVGRGPRRACVAPRWSLRRLAPAPIVASDGAVIGSSGESDGQLFRAAWHRRTHRPDNATVPWTSCLRSGGSRRREHAPRRAFAPATGTCSGGSTRRERSVAPSREGVEVERSALAPGRSHHARARPSSRACDARRHRRCSRFDCGSRREARVIRRRRNAGVGGSTGTNAGGRVVGSTSDPSTRGRAIAVPVGSDGRATYRADEVARLLGVGRDTVYQAAERGEIPGALRIGRRLVFARAPLHAWLRNPAPSEE